MTEVPKRKNHKPTPKNQPAWTSLAYKVAKRLADSPLPEIAFISVFILERWRLNSDFSYPVELLMPIGLFAVLGVVVFYIYRLILGAGLASHFAALPLCYGLYAYQFVLNSSAGDWALWLLPNRWEADLTRSFYIVLVMTLVCGLAGWAVAGLVSHYKNLQTVQPYKVLLFAVAFIFAVQLIRTGNRLWDIRSELSYHYPPPTASGNPGEIASPKPDIYFLMPEDYADAATLRDINQYDNSSLLDFLASQGFLNRQPVAYANYAFTMSSLASNLAMNYFPEFEKQFGKERNWQTGFAYRSVINDPPVAQLLKQNGYQYNQLSSWWDFSRINIKADTNPTKGYRLNFLNQHFFLSDLSRDIVNKSVLSPWLKRGISLGSTALIKYDRDYNPKENLDVQIANLKKIASRADKSLPQFTFAHFMVPHTPFIFNADGSIAEYDGEHNDQGAAETIKYANQVAYFNSQIKEMVGYIRAHSPNAVIIIQSDEGSYPPQFRYEQTLERYYDPKNLPTPQMKQKFSILASYYMPGADPQTARQQTASPVNVFRYVLNQYLGYSLPLLPDCHFASGNKFVVYNYQLVSDKLTGQAASAACEQYAPVKNN